MKKSNDRLIRVSVLACLVITAGLSHTARSAELSTPEAAWAAMTKCGVIAEDAARHACSDDVLQKAGAVPTAEAKSSAQRKQFGLESQPSRAAASAKSPAPAQVSPAAPAQPSAKGSASAPSPAAPRAKAQDDRVEVTLSNVMKAGDGTLVLTTSDGAAWRQSESGVLRPEPAEGQKMTIMKKSFGGFMCVSDKRVAFRCYRWK